MIYPKDEGVGDWKSGKFELSRAPLWEKRFLNFLGKKTPKTSIFPSCGNVLPSLTIWIEQNVFGKPILHSHSNKQEKMILSLNLSRISLVRRSESFTFWGFPMWIVLSHILPYLLVVFPEDDCPESNFVSLI